MHPRLRLIKELIEMIKNLFYKFWEHARVKHFRKEFWDGFIKALANASVGFILFVILFIIQKENGKAVLKIITDKMDGYVQAQVDFNNKFLLHLKSHEPQNDSLKSKNKKNEKH